MERIALINRLLFEYDLLSEDEVRTLIVGLPRKIVRWLATNHPDARTSKLLFRETGVQIGEDVMINAGLVIGDGYKPLVRIGNRVALSPRIMIFAETGPNQSNLSQIPYVNERLTVQKEVIIEDDAWIGAGAIILPGVTIGRGAIVGAGAVVNRSVAPYTIVAGVPAREIRKLPDAES